MSRNDEIRLTHKMLLKGNFTILTIFIFLILQVDDQMKLLQNSWSEMLILDQIHQRLHNHLPDETTLHNGQKFELLSLALLGVPSMAETFQEITNKFTALKFDSADYVCLKFVLLLSPGKYHGMKQKFYMKIKIKKGPEY